MKYSNVSIVLPAHRVTGRLISVVDACCAQHYLGEFEVILVLNGVEPSSHQLQFDDLPVRIIYENEHKCSPYSARNRGIEYAKYDHIALIDGDCVPKDDWLEEGVKSLSESDHDLVAGNVVFEFTNSMPTASELWDSIVNIRQRDVVSSGAAKTASLFVPKILFEENGYFREGVRSGEDVRWTRAVTDKGYRLGFSDKAIVKKQARKRVELLRKSLRTGAGKGAGKSFITRLVRGVGMLLIPPSPFVVIRRVKNSSNYTGERATLLTVWFVAWASRVLHGLGFLFSNQFKHAD